MATALMPAGVVTPTAAHGRASWACGLVLLDAAHDQLQCRHGGSVGQRRPLLRPGLLMQTYGC